MPPNMGPRGLQLDSGDCQFLSDSDDAGAPITFKPVTRKRRQGDVGTPQKVTHTNPGSSSAISSKPTPTRVKATAPLTPASTMPHSISTSRSQDHHLSTPAGRRGGVLKAFNSLSMKESASVSSAPGKSYNRKSIVLSDTDTDTDTDTESAGKPKNDTIPTVLTCATDSGEDSDVVAKPLHQQIPTPESSLTDVDTAACIRDFSERPMDDGLGCSIISHCRETQYLFDLHQIAWGTQYELARGVCGGAWTWADVRSRIDLLKGDNVSSAPNVPRIMRGHDPQKVVSPLWEQLDLEQEAILENKSRGLGLMEPEIEWHGKKRWHGGQIQQVARLVKKSKQQGHLSISLEPMEMRRSHRFARYYGSRRFIQVKIPDTFTKDKNYDKVDESACETIKKFFAQKFILCGRCFVPFHAKEGSVYLLETDGSYERVPQPSCGDQYRMSLNKFLQWHNPLEEMENYEQYISKWVTRFALGLSNSVPAVEFDKDNIFFIRDIVAADWPSNKKAPAEKIMTDGCGFINRAGLAAIAKYLSQNDSEVIIPSGVQGRIGGSKGFWILEPNDSSNSPKIWIRDSQKKIHYPFLDRSHRIFDLLATTGSPNEANLSKQSVSNLFSNGIPESTLVTMMEESLEDSIKPLLEWNDVVVLSNAISRAGNVTGVRAQRAASSRSRALGLSGRDWDNEKHEETDGSYIDTSSSTYTGRNEYSRAPLSLQELALELVQAGFKPDASKYLYEKMKYIILKIIDNAVTHFRIPIKHSFGAYVVPDPLGILEEDEIYFQFSRIRTHAVTGLPFTVLEGDVLVGRYPIRLPSDMRKVRAVNKTQLSSYMDVIITPTKGSRSLASLLAGGDMDGDEWIVFYDRTIVEPFINRPFTDEPPDLNRNFHAEDVEKIPVFCRRMPSQQEFMQKLLSNVEKAEVGIYSSFHERAIVKHGYHNDETIRLAYIFAVLLDSSKNGKRINPLTFQADRKTYFDSPHTEKTSSHPDILKILENTAHRKGKELMDVYTSVGRTYNDKRDPDLKKPYEYYISPVLMNNPPKYAEYINEELILIRNHVNAAQKLYDLSMNQKRSARSAYGVKSGKKSSRDKSDQEDPVLEAARLFSEPLQGLYFIQNVDEVKASYAESLNQNFAFSVAFGTLCEIKAKSHPGGLVASIRIIDEARTFSSAYLKAITKQ